MISVIVPVYNVESYLPKCLDSIIAQTYTDLEILVIDDGSTDRCGAICDSYAERDRRIRVFHTENRGLSAARNLGLDHAKGEYIGFVDSDDWIEPDMYEVLLRKAEETGADVVECGYVLEYPDKVTERKMQYTVMSGNDAVRALLRGELDSGVWNKLWKQNCFEQIRFPHGRIYEDSATTYLILDHVKIIATITASKYHYLQRSGSLSRGHDAKNLTDFWLTHRERFDYLCNQVDEEGRQALLHFCALAAARMWAYYDEYSLAERDASLHIVQEVKDFIRQYIPLFGFASWELPLRFGVLFPHFQSKLSFWLARRINRLYKGVVRLLLNDGKREKLFQ